MSKLVKFPIENSKDHVLVEVEEVKKTGLQIASRAEDQASVATITLNALLRKIKPITLAVSNSVQGVGKPASLLELEFGVKLTEENDVILSQSSSQSNFIIRLKLPGL
jgi:hypothetical protein